MMNETYPGIAGGGALGAHGKPLPPKETPLLRLADALDHLRKAAAGVSSVATSLVGAVPACGNGEAKTENGNGLFGNIEDMADEINLMAGDILSHASRIERRL